MASVLIWMCLSRCKFTSTEIDQHLHSIVSRQTPYEHVTDVAFEACGLGPGGVFVREPLQPVAAPLKSAGFATHAMLSSWPYPTAFILWMRQLFQNPGPFITDARRYAAEHKLDGYNVDFEPRVGATPVDAKAYAAFLQQFAEAMAPVRVSVDFASWGTLWNVSQLISDAPLVRLVDMSTYASSFDTFQRAFDDAIGAFKGRSLNRLSVGLMTYVVNETNKLPASEVARRFQVIDASRVQHVAVWSVPLPQYWAKPLSRFISRHLE